MSYGQYSVYIILPSAHGEDYHQLATILTFGKCSMSECIQIDLVDDLMIERDETFYVTLERTPDLGEHIQLHPTEKRVKILNDDGEWMGMGRDKGRGGSSM